MEKLRVEEDRGNAPVSSNEALLDEFFSLVASITMRLTKEDTQNHNNGDAVGREVIESC